MKSHVLFLILVSVSLTTYANINYTVDNFINDVTEKNAKKSVLSSKNKVSEYQLEQALGITDWQINTSVFDSHHEPFDKSSFTASYINTIGTFLGIDRPIRSTGGDLSFGLTQERISQPEVVYNGLAFNTPLYYQTILGIQYRQPILYGFGGEIYNFTIDNAQVEKDKTMLQSTEEFEYFLQEELYEFINWTLLNELTELSFSRLQLAKESLDQTKERVRVNLSEKIDLLRAEYAFKTSLQHWQTKKAQLKSAQYKIAAKFDDLSIRQKTPVFDLYDYEYVKKPSYIIVKNLRSVQMINLSEPILQKQVQLSESKRNGSLDIIGGFDFLGGADAFNSSLNLDQNNARIALQYSRDLSDTQSIAKLKETKEDLLQFELERDQIITNLESEIIALYTLINEYQEILNVNLSQINTSQEKAAAEEALFKQGRSSIDMLIEAQDNVLYSKSHYAQIAAEYQKFTITYLALIDELLSKYKVSL
ncbi:MAG: TolC family protein [Candidatus Margulisiibacteriota bacterium]|nr:TolC family protein [Candidatus Margulisiibacteriota bacterium]